MVDLSRDGIDLAHHQSMKDCGVHPTNAFVEFNKEEIDQAIPDRFQKQVDKYPDRIAIKTRHQEFTYKTLKQAANRVAKAILNNIRNTLNMALKAKNIIILPIGSAAISISKIKTKLEKICKHLLIKTGNIDKPIFQTRQPL